MTSEAKAQIYWTMVSIALSRRFVGDGCNLSVTDATSFGYHAQLRSEKDMQFMLEGGNRSSLRNTSATERKAGLSL
jgi:hypothetical protein